MKKTKDHYDYIICGGGASGLILASRVCNDNYFINKSILLIEKDIKNTNDRTWCFWEEGKGEYDDIISHSWQNGKFQAKNFELNFSFNPFTYKMIKSKNFYSFMRKKLKPHAQLDQVQEKIIKINTKINQVVTDKNIYKADKIFSSIYSPKILQSQAKFPVLLQHFYGCVIETKKSFFNKEKIDFMNFNVSQKNETRFVYVLPESNKRALVEYTLFSKTLLPEKEYLEEIKKYLDSIDTGGYKILEKEKGQIPMTCFRFDNYNTEDLLHIGTAGGWTKASTGYTFSRINEKTKALINHLKKEKPLNRFNQTNRFWFYDLIFLDVLYNQNYLGSNLFKKMFEKNDPKTIFKFLDDKSNFWEELKIITSFPIGPFLSAFFKRVLKIN